jgi:SAM-dependent methyltransferase
VLPNDDEEVERLQDIQYCIRKLLGRNIVPPISNSPDLIGETAQSYNRLRVVDVGTGSGLWAIQVAEQYPNAQIVGTDISPVQPTVGVPANCEFRLESALDGLKFHDGSVDLLHSRLHSPSGGGLKFSRWLVLGVPADCWPRYLSEVYRVLKPGTGFLQMLEYERKGVGRVYSQNDSCPKTSALYKVCAI